MFWILFIIIYIPFLILYPIKLIGRKKLPKKKKGEGVIYCCNHYTIKDPVLICLKLGKKINFLAKKELFKKGFSSAFLRSLGAFPVDRQNTDRKAISHALNLLKRGKNLGIFPEGTRNKNYEESKEIDAIKNGTVMFAAKTDSLIVPMAFSAPSKVFKKVKLIIGEPFKVNCQIKFKPTKEELENASKLLQNKINELTK